MAFDHVVECRFIGNRQRRGENRQREAQPPRKPLACLIGADALLGFSEGPVITFHKVFQCAAPPQA